MSFDRSVRYPTKWLPPTDSFPFGVPKNSTTETSKDGSPYEKDFISDTEGFFQGMLLRRNIAISGNTDTALISDYLDALGLLVGITHATINDAITDETLKAGMQVVTQDKSGSVRGGGANYLVKTDQQANDDGDVVPSAFNFDSAVSGLVIIVQSTDVRKIDSVENISGLQAIIENQQISIRGYHPASIDGGGLFLFKSGIHDGVTFIDPLRVWPDWTVDAEVDAWFLNTATTIDGWGRIREKRIYVSMAGGLTSLSNYANYKAIQAAMDVVKDVFGDSIYNIGSNTLIPTIESATLQGDDSEYAKFQIRYEGASDCIKPASGVNRFTGRYVKLQGLPVTGTDFYNTGSIGINSSNGTVDVRLYECWLTNFQRLVEQNHNSFYNRFINNRFEKTETIINKIASNNVEFQGNRCKLFHDAIVANGEGGSLNIHNTNTFEVFNGELVKMTGVEQGLFAFHGNYVETNDATAIPTNFPDTNAGRPGFFGGNILFSGPVSIADIQNNELQLITVTRIGSFSAATKIISKNNLIHLGTDFLTNNAMDRMYSAPSGTLTELDIHDIRGVDVGAAFGTYTATYDQPQISTASAENSYSFFDCIGDQNLYNATARVEPTLDNAWAAGAASWGNPTIQKNIDGSLSLSGMIDGASKTGNPVFTIDSDLRPYEYGTGKTFAEITAFASFGDGNIIRFRYLYGSGTLQLEGSPADLTDIPIDGLVIPPRY